MSTALTAVRLAAAGTLVQVTSITIPTCLTTITNVQVTKYAVATGTLENKEKMKVNIIIDLYDFKQNCV